TRVIPSQGEVAWRSEAASAQPGTHARSHARAITPSHRRGRRRSTPWIWRILCRPMKPATETPETRSGLPAWKPADLPEAPRPHGFGWLAAVGPGVIVLGVSIGSGEFLLGPAVFVKYGLTLLWVTSISVLLQT